MMTQTTTFLRRQQWVAGLLLAALVLGLGWPLVAAAQGTSGTPETQTERFTVFGRIEWEVPIQTSVENPYDPEQIEVTAAFSGPDGRLVTVPGFYIQPLLQTCREDCAIEVLEPDGDPGWRVRFAPTLAGQWTYEFKVRRNLGITETVARGEFVVEPGDAPGFVRVADNSRYFRFDDGSPFLPIGPNLAWSWDGGGGIFAYERWLRNIAEAGGNYARLYVDVPWFIGFEWDAPVGNYDAAQDDFWRLDRILEVAAEHGVYLDIVVLWHQALTNYNGVPVLVPSIPARADSSADWRDNPYNVVNGGFLTSTTQFFTEQEARLLFRRRLLYLVARWGYSPNVLSWDLLSAADQVLGYSPTIVLPWLNEMTAYLRDIDANDHLITIGSVNAPLELLDAPGIDYGQVRFYQRRPIADPEDQVLSVVRLIDGARRRTERPVMLTEFSLSPWYEPAEEDPVGIHVRNSMWASLLGGAAGVGSSWWWDTYLEPNDLFAQLRPLAEYAEGVPWQSLRLNPAQIQLQGGQAADYAPLTLDSYDRRLLTDELLPVETIRLTPDGAFPALEGVSAYLYGQTFNTQQPSSQVYTFAAPVDTQLTVAVGSVSRQAGARMVMRIDDVFVGQLDLSVGTTEVGVTIPVSAGEHRLELVNEGDDWLQLEYLRIDAFVPALRAITLADLDAGLFLGWFQNRAYSWVTQDILPQGTGDLEAAVSGLPSGEYQVEFFDTTTGQVIGQDQVRVEDDGTGRLAFQLLPVRRTLAVRAVLLGGPALPTATPLPSPTLTLTATATKTATLTPTHTSTATPLPTQTAANTATATSTATATNTLTVTPEPSLTPLPSNTPRATRTPVNTRPPRPSATPPTNAES